MWRRQPSLTPGGRRWSGAAGVALIVALGGWSATATAQVVSQRGFVEVRSAWFPQDSPNDGTNLVGDLLAREEVFFKPTLSVQFAVGLDARASSHEQVDTSWRVDLRDRGMLRPRLSLRRLGATLHRGPITVDAGKQFIRWGKADIITPTDRFAPRDFLNVIDSEFLPVTGVRAVVQVGPNTIDGAWVPLFTPSRIPLVDQRWSVVPPAYVASITVVDAKTPDRSQAGVRWSHTGSGYELSASFFDGLDHRPTLDVRPDPRSASIEVAKMYPRLRSYGADGAVPTRWFTIKGEAAYVTSPVPTTDEYVLYVLQLERQSGEWALVGGYAGEVVTKRRGQLSFAPDRGLTRALVGRASYTIDGNRSLAIETAIRQNGHGVFAKTEYSHGRGQHWRATATVAVIAGRADEFLGQFRRNSYGSLALRYSF